MRVWAIIAVIAAIGIGAGGYLYYTKVVVIPVATERPPVDHGDFATRFQPKPPPNDGGRPGQ